MPRRSEATRRLLVVLVVAGIVGIVALFLKLADAVRENDLDDCRHRLLASPVALQLAGEGDPANWLSTGLNNALQACAMSFY